MTKMQPAKKATGAFMAVANLHIPHLDNIERKKVKVAIAEIIPIPL